MNAPGAHETWSSRTAFLLAAMGAAVGLGNLWRFPFIAGDNGGGAFVLVYIVMVLGIGMPVMAAEFIMGRRGHQSPVETMRNLIMEQEASGFWSAIGWISILIPILGLSYYSIVAGWSLDYLFKAAVGTFAGLTAETSTDTFNGLLASPWRLLFWHTIFVGMSVFVVARGVRRGLEVAVKGMMPALFGLLLLLVLYGMVAGDFAAGFSFLFNPDFSKLTFPAILMALGQAFFSLAVGVGAMITYGAYLPRTVSIPSATFSIAVADTLVALLAGLAIFPIVFAVGLAPDGGPGLIFQTLPIAFGSMPGGVVIGTLFFVLLSVAAFTSALGMLEPFVSWLEEHRGFSRPAVTVAAGGGAWLLGLVFVLSFNVWSGVRPLAMFELFKDKGLFELMDFFIANLAIPVNVLLIALFAGWVMSRQACEDELAVGSAGQFAYWRAVVRYVAPVAIVIVLLNSVREGLGL